MRHTLLGTAGLARRVILRGLVGVKDVEDLGIKEGQGCQGRDHEDQHAQDGGLGSGGKPGLDGDQGDEQEGENGHVVGGKPMYRLSRNLLLTRRVSTAKNRARASRTMLKANRTQVIGLSTLVLTETH